jgi:hypothetical protein
MDNRYFSYGCPPLMQDGRFLTSYVRSNVFDQFIRNVNQVNSSQEYRELLQTKGDDMLNKERAELIKNNVCNVNGVCLPLSNPKGQNVLPCGYCS